MGSIYKEIASTNRLQSLLTGCRLHSFYLTVYTSVHFNIGYREKSIQPDQLAGLEEIHKRVNQPLGKKSYRETPGYWPGRYIMGLTSNATDQLLSDFIGCGETTDWQRSNKGLPLLSENFGYR